MSRKDDIIDRGIELYRNGSTGVDPLTADQEDMLRYFARWCMDKLEEDPFGARWPRPLVADYMVRRAISFEDMGVELLADDDPEQAHEAMHIARGLRVASEAIVLNHDVDLPEVQDGAA